MNNFQVDAMRIILNTSVVKIILLFFIGYNVYKIGYLLFIGKTNFLISFLLITS